MTSDFISEPESSEYQIVRNCESQSIRKNHGHFCLQVSSSQAGTSIAAGDLSQVQSWPVPSLPARADSGATSTSLVVEGSSDEQQPEPCWLRPRTSIDTGSDILGAQHTHSVHTTEPPRGAPWTSNKAHGHLVGPAVRRAHGSHGHGSQGHHASHSHYSTTAAARSFSSPLQREMSVVEDPAARESSQLTSSTMASTWHTLREASTDVHAHHGGMRRLRSHDFAGTLILTYQHFSSINTSCSRTFLSTGAADGFLSTNNDFQ